MKILKSRKKGIALLTTVGLIMMLSLLILKNVDISQKYFEKAGQSGIFVQMDKTFLNTLGILQESTKDIKDAQALSFVVGLPIVLGLEEGDFNVAIDILSGADVININNLILENNSTNEPLYNFIRTILSDHMVVNADFFMSILLDAIDGDKNERAYASEAAVKSGRFTDGGIDSKESFNFLLEYFTANGGDARIYSVPWFDIIGFWGNGVDFNYMREPLFELIKKQYDLRSLERSDIVTSYNNLPIDSLSRNKLRALGISFFEPTLLCDIKLFVSDQKQTLKFLYDITSKKVGYIETIF